MNNNPVDPTDVAYMSLALGAFGSATAALSAHDYIVAGGMLIIGVVFVYLYHLFGTPTIPAGTTPVVTQNQPTAGVVVTQPKPTPPITPVV